MTGIICYHKSCKKNGCRIREQGSLTQHNWCQLPLSRKPSKFKFLICKFHILSWVSLCSSEKGRNSYSSVSSKKVTVKCWTCNNAHHFVALFHWIYFTDENLPFCGNAFRETKCDALQVFAVYICPTCRSMEFMDEWLWGMDGTSWALLKEVSKIKIIKDFHVHLIRFFYFFFLQV